MATTNLDTIERLVRQLTRSPSEVDLPQAEIYQNINTFLLYDFPQILKLFSLHTTFTFYTVPNVADYGPAFNDQTGPEWRDWINLYPTANPPVFVGGVRATWSQNRSQFYNWWSFINNTAIIATSDGVTSSYTGFISGIPILQGSVNFSAISNDGLKSTTYIDYPLFRNEGILAPPNTTNPTAAGGTINYITGEYTINFLSDIPDDGEPIRVQYVPYTSGRPTAILYYNNIFTLRPVPDKTYPVNIEVYKQPTELLAGNQNPQIRQWWQFIAYGAAMKIFQARMDLDSVAQIEPEFRRQELLVNRTTIQQQGNQRTATIYSQPLPWSGYQGWPGYGPWSWGGW